MTEKKQSISAIREIFAAASETELPALYLEYEEDSRAGVQNLIQKYQKQEEALKKERERTEQMKIYEHKYEDLGWICGIDEVGRGPLAGPVVAGAVILPRDSKILYLNDSKQLTAKKRDELYDVIMREAVAIEPEGRRVFSRMTVEENLAMGGFFADRDQFQTRIKWVYELFPRLHERRIQRAGTMSGGEQQMLAIGRALMSQPRLLLLDEPSLGLAPIIIQQIFDTIEQLREQGMTIFLVEQNANQALKLADRGYVLENGHVVLEDTGDALLANEAVRSAYLGG